MVFQPYKHHHKSSVEHEVREGCEQYNKVEFLQAIKSIRAKTFKRDTIISAWRKAGLWPINLEIVLSKLPLPSQTRPATPPPSFTSTIALSPPTPYKAHEIEAYSKDHLYGMDPLTGLYGIKITRLNKLTKSAIANAAARAVVEVDYARNTAAAKKRAIRQQPDRRHIQKGGVIYVGDARWKAKIRNESDTAKKGRAVARKSAAETRTAVTENNSLDDADNLEEENLNKIALEYAEDQQAA